MLLRIVGVPAVEVLGVEPAVVHPLHAPTAHAYDASVLDGYVEGIAVGVEHGGALYPAVYILLGEAVLEELVDPYGPIFAPPEGRAFAPGVRYTVRHDLLL